MISIEKYTAGLKNAWDDFIQKSNNGTIFQKKSFLNYHLDRKFDDCSLVIKKNNVIVGLLPAAIQVVNNKKILFSHPGASYGGLVLSNTISFSTLNKIVLSVDDYCCNKGFSSLFLINTPVKYLQNSDESLNYLLLWNGYSVYEIYVSHVVDLSKQKDVKKILTKRKQRYINNSSDFDIFKFKPSSSFEKFYDILLETKKKYNSKPTHSLRELIFLKKTFPNECELFLTTFKDRVVGGCFLIFVNKRVSLVFYNVVLDSFRGSQLSTFQLYNCMVVSKKRGVSVVDFGVSHVPEKKNPLAPKLSLIQFKEQFGARGVIRTIFKKDFDVDK